eukprot:s373_g26.t1
MAMASQAEAAPAHLEALRQGDHGRPEDPGVGHAEFEQIHEEAAAALRRLRNLHPHCGGKDLVRTRAHICTDCHIVPPDIDRKRPQPFGVKKQRPASQTPEHHAKSAFSTFIAKELQNAISRTRCCDGCRGEDFEIQERGPLPGAFQLSSGSIMFAKPDLDKKLEYLRRNSKPLVCYTDKGVEKSRCGVVCQWLVDKGFPPERLRRLKGGRDAWQAEGYPTCVYGDEMWQLASQAQLSAAPVGPSLRWHVIGGADKGGILVREGAALTLP